MIGEKASTMISKKELAKAKKEAKDEQHTTNNPRTRKQVR